MDSKKKRLHLGDTVDYIKKLTDGKQMDTGDMLYLTTKLMTFVKEYTDLSGAEKKELVKDAISTYIDGLDLEKENKFLLNMVFKNVIPNAIDLLVDVSKGKYKFKHVKRIFPCC